MERQTSSITSRINSCDVDLYGHLNNAAFPLYFERGREDLAVKNKLDAKILLSQNLAFLVKRASYEYLSPVLADQNVEITSRVASLGGARIIVEQEMFSGKQIIAKAHVEYFFLDLVKNKPIRPPSLPFS